ncbi:MAG: SDR family oxidoreductase [Acidimicrobiaceae bacterium]|nr:SDR family oxidoreductase [Acidimicrobiaceae bacterium]
MRVVVTGGAGFIGSHFCARLLDRGDEVVCLDNFSTGTKGNVSGMEDATNFTFLLADVSEEIPVAGPVDAVVHLASRASPVDYLERPLETLAVGSRGTELALELAASHEARFLLASTSEVYGDPEVHPQPESYWGRVNPVGPRSVYDESKRFAESLSMAYRRARDTDVAIVRIFNTYGPRMRPDDGRVVSNFVSQALAGRPLTVYGDGSQTRSICYVDDLVRGLLAMLDSDVTGPINLGNPVEMSMLELARIIQTLTGSRSRIAYRPLPVDDPRRRQPDISLAQNLLGWQPRVPFEEGLTRTIDWFRSLDARNS